MARRGFAILFTLLGVAFFISIVGFALLYLAFGREPAVASNSTLVLRVGGDLTEVAPADVVSYVRGVKTPTVRSVVDSLRKAKVDGRVRALLLKPTGFESPFWAKVQEIRDAVIDFRKSGKPVYAYLEYARRPRVLPGHGRRQSVPDALDLAGPDGRRHLRTVPARHARQDQRLSGSAPHRRVQDGGEHVYREGLHQSAQGDGRVAEPRSVRADHAGHRRRPQEERSRNPHHRSTMGRFCRRTRCARDSWTMWPTRIRWTRGCAAAHSGGRSTVRSTAAISPSSVGLNRGPRVAVIYASGTITGGKSGYDPVNGPVAGSETLVDYIRQARRDSLVRAIVLRIDSPGGSATASDAIWRELMITRNERADRPLVASMSDLAASGGYYIAMPAQVIVAQPSTLTGSIGIFGGKFVTGGVYEKLGARIESTSIGRNAEINSPARRYNPEELKKLQEQLQAFYDQFVEKVAESRHSTPEKIDALAQGRVWTGRQANRTSWSTSSAGWTAPSPIAKQRAKIAADSDVEVVVYPPRKSFYELLSEQFSGSSDSLQAAALTAWMHANLTRGEIEALRAIRGRASMFQPRRSPRADAVHVLTLIDERSLKAQKAIRLWLRLSSTSVANRRVAATRG